MDSSTPLITKLPTWSIPRIIHTLSEIAKHGTINSIDDSDSECIQIISSYETKYRMDLISKTGSTTTYMNKEIYDLVKMHPSDFILEAVFGPPSPNLPRQQSRESLTTILEIC